MKLESIVLSVLAKIDGLWYNDVSYKICPLHFQVGITSPKSMRLLAPSGKKEVLSKVSKMLTIITVSNVVSC